MPPGTIALVLAAAVAHAVGIDPSAACFERYSKDPMIACR